MSEEVASAEANGPGTTPPSPARCPRHAKPKQQVAETKKWATWQTFYQEPFRLFFPLATMAGFIGVLLWVLMYAGWLTDYPGIRHARLMVNGFFGGFILGFLSTSVPRIIETKPFSQRETLTPLFIHALTIIIYTIGSILLGDALFLLGITSIAYPLLKRWSQRADLPPPGFVLIPLAFSCAFTGLATLQISTHQEVNPQWELLGRLLAYHCFTLLCILAAGGFLLPRFLGLGVREKFTTTAHPSPEWKRAALRNLIIGIIIEATYAGEAMGWSGSGNILRVAVILFYFAQVMNLKRFTWSFQGVQWMLSLGLLGMLAGIITAGIWPAWRIGLSHLELIGGFALITLAIATRIVFGHSGQRSRLEKFHPAITTSAIFILSGMLTRIFGDIVPSTQSTHYLYGALCWLGGLALWSVIVLPGVTKPDPEN